MNVLPIYLMCGSILFATLSACSKPLDLDKTKRDFLANRALYEQLNKMVRQEKLALQGRPIACFELRRHWGKFVARGSRHTRISQAQQSPL